ncbi:MAG: hypothetical protein AUI13_08025 [Gemmatimonadetes bacterium 13_2_20CM_2_69_23]|nr:MAG: hypothetical protein AUI13_08025 [Gemmatimonadetes bacterium 13_2_20CM_2_69_23]
MQRVAVEPQAVGWLRRQRLLGIDHQTITGSSGWRQIGLGGTCYNGLRGARAHRRNRAIK